MRAAYLFILVPVYRSISLYAQHVHAHLFHRVCDSFSEWIWQYLNVSVDSWCINFIRVRKIIELLNSLVDPLRLPPRESRASVGINSRERIFVPYDSAFVRNGRIYQRRAISISATFIGSFASTNVAYRRRSMRPVDFYMYTLLRDEGIPPLDLPRTYWPIWNICMYIYLLSEACPQSASDPRTDN